MRKLCKRCKFDFNSRYGWDICLVCVEEGDEAIAKLEKKRKADDNHEKFFRDLLAAMIEFNKEYE